MTKRVIKKKTKEVLAPIEAPVEEVVEPLLPEEVVVETPELPEKVEEDYVAVIKIVGKPFSAVGKSVREALDNLKVGNAKGASLLTITKGAIAQHKILTPPQTFRLFTQSRMMREVTLKQITSFFNL